MLRQTKGDYAEVNGLRMYYEVHGEGRPLVLLHGAYMTVEAMGSILPGLAETRRVIVPEMQGHGRTADIDRPITYEGMADDVAALLGHLGIGEADAFGYSMGGGVALQLTIRHPGSVRRLVVASASYTSDGMQPELHEMIPTITPEMFAGSPMEAAYQELAPNPEDFPTLVEKMKRLDMTPFAWPAEDIRGIESPTMIVVGDADVVRLEHAVEMFRLLGGGAMGQRGNGPGRVAAVDGPAVSRRALSSGGANGKGWGVTSVLDIADPARLEEAGEFQERLLGASVSVIVVDAPPGGGPRLHRHPYEENFVVQEGSANFTAGEDVIEARGGQVVEVPAGVAHKFVNSGATPLRQVNIHASDHFVTEWLE